MSNVQINENNTRFTIRPREHEHIELIDRKYKKSKKTIYLYDKCIKMDCRFIVEDLIDKEFIKRDPMEHELEFLRKEARRMDKE